MEKREIYQFTEDCIIGVDIVDEEHRGLFNLINEVLNSIAMEKDSAEVTIELLGELKDYADTHFAHEEEYMEKINDPELELQRREHQAFREKVNSIDVGRVKSEDEKKALEDMMKYLTRWLYHHIIGSDILIGKMKKESIGKRRKVEFTDEYRTGIQIVDEEHEVLFDIIQQAMDAVYAENLADKYDVIMNILYELKEYTNKHFSDEEEHMTKIGYEGLRAQKLAHESFVDKLNDIDLDDMDDNQQEYLINLVEFLLTWLKNHILSMDKFIPLY